MSSHIAINGRFQQRRITGVDRYAHEISKRLTMPNYFITPSYSLGRVTGHLWEQLFLPARIRTRDLLWSPANTGPWTVQNQIITIHDASVFDHPEWFDPTFALWTRLSWKVLAKRAKAIFTVSNFSRERLKFHLEIPEEKIHVIHNGVGKPFEPQPQKSIERVKEKYGIKKPYFLFVGTKEPRKNLAGLAQAWKLLGTRSHSLFIAGAEGNVFANQTHHEVLLNQTYVPDEDLPALYSGATSVINPSVYEGFGLTILEAMACGAPVIAADISVFREIFDGTVLFFNPYYPNELASTIQKVTEDKSCTNVLIEKSLAHASRFSWDESARRTQTILESLA
ncbi:MAG: glycosyltransferase family 4 protein [Anaerolineales bacterium]|nr:glycosyltransferase family 4 protein [Anaerolineales bacterium]